MALTSTKKLENNLYEIEFNADKATFDDAVNKVFAKKSKEITVPGFRKGKAPRAMIEKLYGMGAFYDDAINDILPSAYEDAIKGLDIDVVSKPEFDLVSMDNGVTFKAKFYVKPEVSIKNYKGISVKKDVKKVTASDVANEIEKVRERNSRVIDVTDRDEVKNGDIAVIDFDGSVDGKAFDGGKSENYNLTIGSGSFIPGFEEQIIGHKVGEHFDVNVKFPKEYHAKELAGKDAVFKIVLHAIKLNELPELNDEFAKDVSEFDTLAEYKADVKAKLEKANEDAADKSVEAQVIDALVANIEADIPQVMFDNEVENCVRDYDYNLRSQGLDLNTYFKYTGLTLEKMREQFKPVAERQVKTRLALEQIAKLEKIEVTEDEINGEYENIAKMYNMEVAKVKEVIESSSIKADMAVKKAVDFLKANVKVATKTEKKEVASEDATAEEKKPAPKKATATKTTAKSATEKTAEAPKKAPAKKSTAKKAE